MQCMHIKCIFGFSACGKEEANIALIHFDGFVLYIPVFVFRFTVDILIYIDLEDVVADLSKLQRTG